MPRVVCQSCIVLSVVPKPFRGTISSTICGDQRSISLVLARPLYPAIEVTYNQSWSVGSRLRSHWRNLHQHPLTQGPCKRCDVDWANTRVTDGVLLNLLSAFL